MFEGTLWECACFTSWTNRFFIWVIILYACYYFIKYLYNRANAKLDLKFVTVNHKIKNMDLKYRMEDESENVGDK